MARQTTYLDPAMVPASLKHGYNGRKFKAVQCDEVALTNTYWDGGTRSTWTMVNLSSGVTTTPNGSAAPARFGGTLESRKASIPQGFAVVEHSIFCGKDMGLTFYIRSEDIAPLLPPPSTLSSDELIVLEATATYKNTYGGRTNLRFKEAARTTGITAERWEAAKASLIASEHLRKNGSITTKGKNMR